MAALEIKLGAAPETPVSAIGRSRSSPARCACLRRTSRCTRDHTGPRRCHPDPECSRLTRGSKYGRRRPRGPLPPAPEEPGPASGFARSWPPREGLLDLGPLPEIGRPLPCSARREIAEQVTAGLARVHRFLSLDQLVPPWLSRPTYSTRAGSDFMRESTRRARRAMRRLTVERLSPCRAATSAISIFSTYRATNSERSSAPSQSSSR